MTSKRNCNEEIVKQCREHFEREKRYWQRLKTKRIAISKEQFEAKNAIIEYLYNMAAGAALKIETRSVIDDLMWDYRELMMNVADYKEMIGDEYA